MSKHTHTHTLRTQPDKPAPVVPGLFDFCAIYPGDLRRGSACVKRKLLCEGWAHTLNTAATHLFPQKPEALRCRVTWFPVTHREHSGDFLHLTNVHILKCNLKWGWHPFPERGLRHETWLLCVRLPTDFGIGHSWVSKLSINDNKGFPFVARWAF